MRTKLRWWLPALIAIGILIATSWPAPPAMPHGSDKVVHFTSYAFLGGAVAWAAMARSWRRALGWIAVVSCFGAADEWHQQFITGRATDVRDWIADTAGAVTGLSLVTALARRREFVA